MENKKKHVVFVTGAFVTNRTWDQWIEYFLSAGYEAIAPAWPFKEGTAPELRARQGKDTDLALLTLSELIDHYSEIVSSFTEKPIVIGHSLGGMMTQVIVNRGLAAAGIAIHPVPTLGVFPYEWSFLRGGWRSLGLFSSRKKTYLMSFPKWQYAFVNGMPLHEQQAAWQGSTVPESKTVARGGLTKAAAVDYDKPHAPLLITSGSTDNIIPAHLNRRNFNRYKKNGSILEYKEFPGRNHYTVGQPGWEADADFILSWLDKVGVGNGSTGAERSDRWNTAATSAASAM